MTIEHNTELMRVGPATDQPKLEAVMDRGGPIDPTLLYSDGHMSSMAIAYESCMISSVGVVTILDSKGSW